MSTPVEDDISCTDKCLTSEEIDILEAQNARMVSEFRANQLEQDAKKHWDLFYKRNSTKFFKNRHWTTREFNELIYLGKDGQNVLLEVGCGVGNFVYPLIQDGLYFKKIFACDFSTKAIELFKANALFNLETINAFQADITVENSLAEIDCPVNIATLIFVLSAIHPDKFQNVARNIYNALAIGGILLFRDYGLYDMAQLRFKPGHKISENYYMRQDGTRTYYFSMKQIIKLFSSVGFQKCECYYVHRRTVNLSENIDVPRIFVQARFVK